MNSQSEPPVSHWIFAAKAGDADAMAAIWNRYYEQLIRLARRKLATAPRRMADEQDVALSALASFRFRPATERVQ